jgi:hypothetical protein
LTRTCSGLHANAINHHTHLSQEKEMKIRTRSNLILTLLLATLLAGCKGEGSQYAGRW